jgi:eukaryotic-like serine/threonine-protein kinase
VTTPPSESGERLLDGRYELGERLGGGAVADVYRALDDRLQRPVAIKLFRGDAADQLQRHEAEMRTLAALDHPSLVTVFDAGTDEDTGRPFLVMQLVEGSTLGDELRSGSMTAQRAARYGAELADALGYVHERGLVHRDVKPANVLISEDGRVHLADFGIARIVDSAHETKTGDVLGTPAYFAPEQVTGEMVGPLADIYALGIVLFECLTGSRPFEGTAVEVAMARVAREPDIPADLPGGWRSLLAAMTRREPSARPSAADVATALRRLAAGESLEHTVAMPTGAAATTILPPATVATQAMPQVAAEPTPAPTPVAARRGPSRAAVAVIVLVVVAIAAAVIIAVERSGDTSSDNVNHGKPRLHQPLERDVRHLENLVHP